MEVLMKMFKKLALITLVSTAVFQAQAISFNDISQFAKDNPKTTAALALTYAIGVKFNLNRTGQIVTRQQETITNEPGVKTYRSLTTTKREHTLIQKLGSYLFPFIYGIAARN
jgi:hypothetical protein